MGRQGPEEVKHDMGRWFWQKQEATVLHGLVMREGVKFYCNGEHRHWRQRVSSTDSGNGKFIVVEDKGKRVISSLFYLSPKLGHANYNLTPMAYMRIMFFSGR
jgi:hypothetical protein